MMGIIDVFKEAMQEVKVVQSYPTEARRRQKATARAGHIAKKRPQVVEEQFDDCSEEFGLLRKCLEDQYLNIVNVDIDHAGCDEDYFFMNISPHFGLNGCWFEATNPR